MYDAARNAHLEVVQLLLERGAIPSLKSRLGETPLDVLQKKRTGAILTDYEEILYSSICNKIHSSKDRTNNELLSETKTPVSKVTSPRRRNIINDDTDDKDINLSQHVRQQLPLLSDDCNDSVEDCKVDKAVSGVNEYGSAISALRNRNICEDDDLVVKKNKQKSALLAPEEVDDDWLDDDLGVSKNKKRKLNDPLTTVAKKASYENLKDTIHNLNSINEPLIESNKPRKKSRISDVVDISENSSDAEQFQRNENVCPRISPSETMRSITRELNDSRRDSRQTMRKKWKTQSTLLKAGFQRKREDADQSSNSGSDTEFVRKDYNKKLTLSRKNENIGTFKRHSSGENFTYNDGFNIVQNLNPNIMQSMNVIQPINIVQSSKNGRPVQTQILPPAAVKVQVEDKVLMISLKLDMINKLTISWLVEEVKSRYYK